MYLSEVKIKNFRCFDDSEHIFKFNSGLNLLVGENDSGKTAVIDAIRYALGTTDSNWIRVEPTDFYNEDDSKKISIQCKFEALTDEEKAAFLECLTHENDDLVLYINCNFESSHKFSTPRIISNTSSGINEDGGCPSSEAREILRTTYLRPLRDAYLNMQAGKNSRLSQILSNIENINVGNAYDGKNLSDLSLTEIAELGNKLLNENSKLQKVSKNISDKLTNEMLLNGENANASLEVSNTDVNKTRKLIGILEKLDLKAKINNNHGKIGLGTSNILSMACEMLLTNEKDY